MSAAAIFQMEDTFCDITENALFLTDCELCCFNDFAWFQIAKGKGVI